MRINSVSAYFLLSSWTILFSFSIRSQTASQDTVTLVFGGDVTFADHFEDEVGDSLSYPFAKLRTFADADIGMVNLENPITTRGTLVPKEFNFRAHPKYTRVLKAAGVEIVTLGNNHICDYGDEGIFDTMQNLDSLGIQHVGAGMNTDDARMPVIVNMKGIRIAFLGYLGFVKTSSLRFASAATAGPAIFSLDDLKEDIDKLKGKADYIVLNVHWGVEKSHVPEQHQISLAHEAVKAGADAIIGHHPHVLQGIERYRGKVVAYSLGNFLFGGNSLSSYSTALLKITIPVHDIPRARAELIPVYVHRWQPYALQGTQARTIIEQVTEYSRMFSDNIFKRH